MLKSEKSTSHTVKYQRKHTIVSTAGVILALLYKTKFCQYQFLISILVDQ